MVGRAAPALFAEALRRFGKVTFRAAGHSMLPAIPPGQLVRLVHATIEDVQPGDVIVYVERGRLVAHRLVRKTQRGRAIVTRGDAHLACDRPVTGHPAPRPRRGRPALHDGGSTSRDRATSPYPSGQADRVDSGAALGAD